MEQMNLFEEKEEKPSFMQKARDYFRNKWVNAAGGIVLASTLALGTVPKANAQEEYMPAQEQAQVAERNFNINRTQQNASFMGITAGDHDFSRNLDFILEDYSLADKKNNPFMLWVHERWHPSNSEVLDEVKKRINNPDQYPMIEAIGTYKPIQPYGRFDGRLDLEAIITRDVEGNEDIFYTDSSDSNFYYMADNYFFNWAFFPGRNLRGFHYPMFTGLYPHWDWDGDGIPNWFDFSPYRWDPWNSFMFDPFYNMNYWQTPGWFGWNYWNYWGGPDYYVNINIINDHDGKPVHWNKYLSTITRDQLKDPNHAPSAINAMKQLRANIESHIIVLTNEQLQQRDQFVKRTEKQNYEGLLKNPQIKTRGQDGREKTLKVNPRDYNPDNFGRVTQRGEAGRPDRVITVAPERVREMNKEPSYTGNIERNTERNIERNIGTDRGAERNIERNTERNPPNPPVIRDPPKTSPPPPPPEKKTTSTTGEIKKKHEPSYSSSSTIRNYESSTSGRTAYTPRSTTTTYPSRTQGDITGRLNNDNRIIRPTPSQVNKYSTPSRTTYNPRSNATVRSPSYTRPSAPSSTRYSSPNTTRSSSSYNPSTIRSSPSASRSSGSYKAPSSSRSSGSSSSRGSSSGSVKKK